MDKIQIAKQLRQAIQFQVVTLPDEQAILIPSVFPTWDSTATYQTGNRVQYGELLYKCLQSHTAQADWTPDAAVSLWVRIDDPAEEWPEWRQPQGAHDAYARMGAGGVRLDGGGVNGQLHHAGGA